MAGQSLDDLARPAHIYLRGLEAEIRDHVLETVRGRPSGPRSRSDDDLFAAFNHYVATALWTWPLRAVRLWLTEIEPLVKQLDIHKGAVLYNVGLCFFVSGDYRRAMQYIAAAAEEDELLAPGSAKVLVTGGGAAEQVLIDPLSGWLSATFGGDYKAATGKDLDKAEFQGLVNHIGRSPADAMLLLSAAHALLWQTAGPDNPSSRLQRVRALADLLVVFESSLRRWLINKSLPGLSTGCEELLRPNRVAFDAFKACENFYGARGISLKDTVGVNRMLNREPAEFDAAVSTAHKAGIVCFVSARSRNAILHLVDDQLALYADHQLLARVFGFALACLRLSQHGEEGTLASL